MSTSSNNNTRPSTNMPPDHVGLLIASFIIALASWFGLFQLLTTSLPRIAPELWIFFFLLQLAVTCTAVPIVRFFNVRLTSIMHDVPPAGVIVRQSVWIGLFVVIVAWLQIPRALSLPLALFVALVFIVVEVFLRSREFAAERD